MSTKTKIFLIVFIFSILVVFVAQYYFIIIPFFFISILFFAWLFLFSQAFSLKVENIIAGNKPTEYFDFQNQEQVIDIVEEKFDTANLQVLFDTISTERNQEKYFQKLFSGLSSELNIYQGLLFLKKDMKNISDAVFSDKKDTFFFAFQYALFSDDFPESFTIGEGLHGQAVLNKKISILEEFSNRIIVSGLGKVKPACISIIPLINKEENVWGVMELAFVKDLTFYQKSALDYLIYNLSEISIFQQLTNNK